MAGDAAALRELQRAAIERLNAWRTVRAPLRRILKNEDVGCVQSEQRVYSLQDAFRSVAIPHRRRTDPFSLGANSPPDPQDPRYMDWSCPNAVGTSLKQVAISQCDVGDPFCYEQRPARAAFKPRGPAHARLLVRPCGLRPVLAGTGGLRRSVVFCFAEASRADLFRERFPASGSTRKSAGAAQLGTGGSCAKVALRSGASANECLSVPQPQLAESRQLGTDALCHVWTAPSWQGKTSRRRLGRCSHVFGLLTRFT